MNIEVRELLADATRAAAIGQWGDALDAYRAAGDRAVAFGLYRAARRCYQRALEIDLFAEDVLDHLIRGTRRPGAFGAGGVAMWEHYLEAVPAMRPVWRSANARLAYLLVGDRGAVLTHPAVGSAIARIEMGTSGDVTVRREPAFALVPDAMLLIMLRRILWHAPRDRPGDEIASVVVRFDDDDRSYRLFENGDWE